MIRRRIYLTATILAGVALPVCALAFTLGNIVGKDVPFGGTVATFPLSFPCTCSPSGVYYMTIFSGTSKVTLTYQAGTQKYANKNLPYAAKVLGLYDPTTRSQCKIYVGTSCSVVPAMGKITSTVGSSGF